ncbi:Aldehyde dehydrogenase 8 member A1 [Mactra antiquata]
MSTIQVQNFINGEFCDSERHLDSFDPSTGEVWAKIPDSSANDVEQAVKAAKDAFVGWSDTPVQERSKILLKIADILEQRLDEVAEIESKDQGKPLWLAKTVDIPRAVYNFRFFATSALHDLNRSSQMQAVDAFNYTIKMPVGVAGLISPWNLPLYLLSFKLAPALIAGNTVVAKPSEMTSVSAWKLAEIFVSAGLPAGVINLVFGTGPTAGECIVKHPDVPIVSFTGGTVTATKLRIAAAPFSKKLSLELGGKNPGVIFNDTDLDKCIPTTVRSSFMNQGEICLCTSRLYVQRDIYQTFVDRFVTEVKKLVVGPYRSEGVFMGPLISKEHLAKVKGYVELARKEGATILCGDEDLNLSDANKNGYFMRPTVIVDIKDTSRCMTEEIFGPVVCIVLFDTIDEVIQRANSVKYGLSATVWTSNVTTLHKVSHKLHAGTVWANCWLVRDLNMPFGGMKESGTGRESAKDSLEFFTEEKTICVKL